MQNNNDFFFLVLGFPFDLQVPAAESNSAPSGANVDDCPANNVPPNVTKSLPDFLNDGPIRNRGQMPSDRSGSNSAESPEMRVILCRLYKPIFCKKWTK